MFLLLAGIFAAMQIPGVLLLRLPSEREVAAIAKMDAEMEEEKLASAQKKDGDENYDDKHSISSSEMEVSSLLSVLLYLLLQLLLLLLLLLLLMLMLLLMLLLMMLLLLLLLLLRTTTLTPTTFPTTC